MQSGVIPDKVSNRLLWAQVSELYGVVTRVEKNDKRIRVLETVAKLVALAVIGLALKTFLG